ncbi:kinase-like protein [Heliocybe sulcata]|uniref:Kinase-like protein n=1 Tax=Heliocybe sulcata TaxID=5364 RepID=A0A5C3NN44_9AGAM|nr:kinase-like protein [Heliocybe sulcata]
MALMCHIPVQSSTPRSHSRHDSDSESLSSPGTSHSFDEDEVNSRTTPYWPKYQVLLELKGIHLDTHRDVQEFYQQHCAKQEPDNVHEITCQAGYINAFRCNDSDALCPDPGLPDNLFRGTRLRDGLKVIVKAVHLLSREFDIIRRLVLSPLRDDPTNHTIPVHELVEVPCDNIAFIVMEEWQSLYVIDPPCCLRNFLCAVRQCIEHVAFLHRNHIAHLDISMRNLLTDNNGRYGYIDYELSHQFEGVTNPMLCGYRGTEVAPELENGEFGNPYKADVWALGIFLLRCCKLTGYSTLELSSLVRRMLSTCPDERPSAAAALEAFDATVPCIGEDRLQMSSFNSHHSHG